MKFKILCRNRQYKIMYFTRDMWLNLYWPGTQDVQLFKSKEMAQQYINTIKEKEALDGTDEWVEVIL